MLVAERIAVSLGARQVLHGVDFAARPGEVTAIVGPNGSGKTTLLRALSGDVPFRGAARLNGVAIARAPVWQLAAMRAVLAQSTPVGFAFTVLEVVRLGLAASAGREADPRAALAQVGLAGYEARLFPELSGGEQARVHLARVLVQLGAPTGPDGPRWLFLDEPVAALDIGHQLQVMRLAADFARAGGGVVAVLHDLNLTAQYAASTALLAEGRLVAQGPTSVVLSDSRLSAAYRCPIRLNVAPETGRWFLPQMAGAAPAGFPVP